MGSKYATVFTRDLLSAKEAEAMEPEEKQTTVERAWNEFLSRDLPAIKTEFQCFG
jgi:hypothetical protein